mmetsp:Transcript_132994/g.384624  ORF Transcript_132994/g.384624 Transcript_132994/m.384624 type:complete len:220 (-) Transcript_132994:1686-2345(-)
MVQHALRTERLGQLHGAPDRVPELPPAVRNHLDGGVVLLLREQRHRLGEFAATELVAVVVSSLAVELHRPQLVPQVVGLIPHGRLGALRELPGRPRAPALHRAHGVDGGVQADLRAAMGRHRAESTIHVEVLDPGGLQSRLELPGRQLHHVVEATLQHAMALGEAAESIAEVLLQRAQRGLRRPELELPLESAQSDALAGAPGILGVQAEAVYPSLQRP